MQKKLAGFFIAAVIALAFCAGFHPSPAHAKVYWEDDGSGDKDAADKDQDSGSDNQPDMDNGKDSDNENSNDNGPDYMGDVDNYQNTEGAKKPGAPVNHPAVTRAPVQQPILPTDEEDLAAPPPPPPHPALAPSPHPAPAPPPTAYVPSATPAPAPPPAVYVPSAPPAPASMLAPDPVKKSAVAPTPAPPPAEPAPQPIRSGDWWHPHPGTKWAIQYAGHIDTSLNVSAYDLDLVDTDPATVQKLHARGIKVICYFSAGSYEKWRPDAQQFPASILGKPNGWKDEKWLDIRRIDILKPIMQARIKMAAEKGCDAIDPDNVEGFDNNSGFPLRSNDQIAYNKMISSLGHSMGMAVGLKNDLEQVEDLLPYFDFQVNEQCFEYKSCNELLPFVKANKPVFNIEYSQPAKQFCPQANKMNFDSLKKDLDLDAKVEACR